MCLRLLILALILWLARNYLATGYAATHDWFWRRSNATAQHCPEDLRRLLHAGRPGAWMLEHLGQEEAWAESSDSALVPQMLTLAHDAPNPRVRAAAIRGLARFWDPAITPTLERALSDPAPNVRAAAGHAIADLELRPLYGQLVLAQARETDRAAKDTLTASLSQTRPAAAPTTDPAGPTVRVAAIQFRSDFAKPAENRRRLEPLIRSAADAGAKIIVLPETAITGYTSEDFKTVWKLPNKEIDGMFASRDPHGSAETVPGPSTAAFAKLAGELKIYLTAPLLEHEPAKDQFFNTIVLLGPDGKLVGHYRKLNPWPVAESGWATKGDRGLVTLDTEFGRLGLLVCYDINFEPANLHARKIDMLLYCIAWVDSAKSRWFQVDLPRLAQNNQFAIIGANWTISRKYDWSGYGHSLIIDRQGQVLSRAKDDLREEIIYADLAIPDKKPK